jgi:hypothetical protein
MEMLDGHDRYASSVHKLRAVFLTAAFCMGGIDGGNGIWTGCTYTSGIVYTTTYDTAWLHTRMMSWDD